MINMDCIIGLFNSKYLLNAYYVQDTVLRIYPCSYTMNNKQIKKYVQNTTYFIHIYILYVYVNTF